MLKNLLVACVFAVLCLLMIEQSYRVYAVGLNAFNPVRFNSMNLLMQSGLVELSEHPALYYELRPNLDTWFQGVRFRTNGDGMADQAYTRDKPSDVFRVAVVGSSWTMGTGVEQADTYHSVMERELSAADPARDYEFLNFGVEYYGLREVLASARLKALDWDPDMIVMAVTSFTAFMRWDEPPSDQQLPARTYPFFTSYAMRSLNSRFDLGLYDGSKILRPTLDSAADPRYLAQLFRAIEELHEISDQADAPAAFMWLSFGGPGRAMESALREKCDELGIIYVDAYNALRVPRAQRDELQNGRFDQHPNAKAHELIAGKLKEAMLAHHLIPGT